MKRIFVIALAVLVSGCTAPMPRTVDIPIAVPCTPPPAFERPRLAIRNLRPDMPPAEIERTYAETVEQMAGYAAYLEKLLHGYREGSSVR